MLGGGVELSPRQDKTQVPMFQIVTQENTVIQAYVSLNLATWTRPKSNETNQIS